MLYFVSRSPNLPGIERRSGRLLGYRTALLLALHRGTELEASNWSDYKFVIAFLMVFSNLTVQGKL